MTTARLNGVKTRTTRYRSNSGWRAVLLWSDYQWLLSQIEVKPRRGQWEAVISDDMCIIPIGWKGSGDYPLSLNGKYLRNPEALARKIVAALNRGKV